MALPCLMTRRRRGALTRIVLNGVLQAAISLALVSVVGAAVAPEPSRVPAAVLAAAAGALGLALFALRVLQRRQGDAFALDYVKEIRLALVNQLLALPATATPTRLGLVMTRLVTDLTAIKSWLADGIASLLVAIPSVTLIIAGAFWLAGPVVPFLLAGVAVWLATTALALPFLRRRIRESRRLRGRLAGRLGDAVLGRTALAHFGRAGPTTRRIEAMSDRLNERLVARAGWSGMVRAATDFVMPTTIVALVIASLFRAPAASASEISTLLLLAGLIVAQLTGLARAADYQLAFLESRRRIASVLEAPPLSDPVDPVPLARASAGRTIRLELVDRATPLIFEAPAGSVVLLAGGTRTERSDLITRVAGLEPDGGIEVSIDGVALWRISLRDRRRSITLVSPGIPLVRGTVLENIALGAPSRSSAEDIRAVAAVCGLGEGVNIGGVPLTSRIESPLAIDPPLAARIRAARALARDAAFILVDDPLLIDDHALLGRILIHARKRQTTVIVSDAPAHSIAIDRVWSLDGAAPASPAACFR